MSSNYNKLSKDKICKELFQIENIETKLQEPNDKVTSEEKKFIDELLKDKDILFKDEKECASRAHSTDYFMKKTDLIKIIKKYPEIEKLLPNDYSKFNKTKLCNELFKI
jgi:hemerythrin